MARSRHAVCRTGRPFQPVCLGRIRVGPSFVLRKEKFEVIHWGINIFVYLLVHMDLSTIANVIQLKDFLMKNYMVTWKVFHHITRWYIIITDGSYVQWHAKVLSTLQIVEFSKYYMIDSYQTWSEYSNITGFFTDNSLMNRKYYFFINSEIFFNHPTQKFWTHSIFHWFLCHIIMVLHSSCFDY